MVRKLTGAIAGIATAVITVMIMEWLSHELYPIPSDLDIGNSEALATHIAGAPFAALLLVLAGYILATFDGILVACLVSRARPSAYALLIGLLMLAATTSNLIMIPHPTWFSAAAVIGIIASAWIAAQFATRLIGAKGDE